MSCGTIDAPESCVQPGFRDDGAVLVLAGGADRGSASNRAALPTWQSNYHWSEGDGYVGWHSDTTASDDYRIDTDLGGEPGLWQPMGTRSIW